MSSAEGAKYDSQGQAPSAARRVGPGSKNNNLEALKERNNRPWDFALSVLYLVIFSTPGATVLASLVACPWLSYFAPSALRTRDVDCLQPSKGYGGQFSGRHH